MDHLLLNVNVPLGRRRAFILAVVRIANYYRIWGKVTRRTTLFRRRRRLAVRKTVPPFSSLVPRTRKDGKSQSTSNHDSFLSTGGQNVQGMVPKPLPCSSVSQLSECDKSLGLPIEANPSSSDGIGADTEILRALGRFGEIVAEKAKNRPENASAPTSINQDAADVEEDDHSSVEIIAECPAPQRLCKVDLAPPVKAEDVKPDDLQLEYERIMHLFDSIAKSCRPMRIASLEVINEECMEEFTVIKTEEDGNEASTSRTFRLRKIPAVDNKSVGVQSE